MHRTSRSSSFIWILSISLLTACSSSLPLTDGDFRSSGVSEDSVLASIPDYRGELQSLKGKGRAIVSEPDNSDRLTIEFSTTKDLSLLTFQNRIGIEGGKLLVDPDSILIYNKLDDWAEKISIYDNRLTSLNELASINFLKLINYTVEKEEIVRVMESNNSYRLGLKNGAQVYVNRESGLVGEVIQTRKGTAPYSRIIYESYGKLEGFILPRKITIFSSDGDSRVVFLIRSLQLNPDELDLTLEIPDNIVIVRL